MKYVIIKEIDNFLSEVEKKTELEEFYPKAYELKSMVADYLNDSRVGMKGTITNRHMAILEIRASLKFLKRFGVFTKGRKLIVYDSVCEKYGVDVEDVKRIIECRI